jgi:radical SAM superfamily enzyme YgiQ (UPF0313 family)
MKVTLAALNASYSHTSLACAYLESFCQDSRWHIDTMEFTINEPYGSILSRLFAAHSDVYGFSCYIWNIDIVKRLCDDLKLARPDCFIVLGGPEVSYDAEQLMHENAPVDAVIYGEGEVTMRELLHALYNGQALAKIPGLVARQHDLVIVNPPRAPLKDLNLIPSPVPFMDIRRGLVYYETSRGCPFNCSYCLSACDSGIRFFSLERVKRDLQTLMQSQAKVVKFVDRSFNCFEKRARQIMDFILAHNISTRFHLEINAELLSDEMLDYLASVPAGIFDFEIGIQSTYPPTLKAINRYNNWNHLRDRIQRLQEMGNIHLHVDLIAGLPYETYEQFQNSFNQVFNLQADVIQLGFLKMLKGSPLRSQAENYHYIYQQHAPYEVLGNHVLSFEELDRLHFIEDMLERYYNSHHFQRTIDYLTRRVYDGQAFKFFEELAWEWQHSQYHLRQHNRETEYVILLKFIKKHWAGEYDLLQELLKLDYLSSFPTGHLPEEFERFNPNHYSDYLYSCLKDDKFISNHFPQLTHLSPRQRRRRIHLEWLKVDINYNTYSPWARPTFMLYNAARNKLETMLQQQP